MKRPLCFTLFAITLLCGCNKAYDLITGVNEEGTAIICHSYNPEPRYRDYETEFSNINQLAVVVGMIRPEE